MATVNNKAINNGTVTNKAISGGDITWNDATFSWDAASGTWGNPLPAVKNKAINNASITNKS